MAWSSELSSPASPQTVIDNVTEEYTDAISLNPGETAAGYVIVDNESGTITNNLRIRVYISTDAGTSWGAKPIVDFEYVPTTVASHPGPPVSVTGWPTFRIGFLSTGATDTYTAQYKYKKDGVSL